MLEPAQGPATVVQPDAMGELRPRKRIDLQDVMQEFDELIGSRADLRHRVGLLDRVEIVTHMVDAAAGRCHDIVEAGEVLHKQRLGAGRVHVEPAVRHRLAAARLVERIDELMSESLEQLEGGDVDLGKNASM
jgi:hypothetical protein